MYPFINILGWDIPTYSILLVVGVGVALVMLKVLSTKMHEVEPHDVMYTFLIGICGGAVGAVSLRPIMRTVEVLLSWQDYRELSIIELFQYVVGEIVFYGGFLGGLVAVIVFCRTYKINLTAIFDISAPALALAHAIGRMGCFFAGCCFGRAVPYNHRLAIVYPPASLAAPSGIPLIAVPLIEAGFLLILSAVLVVLFLVTGRRGICASVYLIVYPIGRFILEFFRGDIMRGRYGLLTTSQYISIGVFIFGVLFLIQRIRLHRAQRNTRPIS